MTEELAWVAVGEDPDGDGEAVPRAFVDVGGETDADLIMSVDFMSAPIKLGSDIVRERVTYQVIVQLGSGRAMSTPLLTLILFKASLSLSLSLNKLSMDSIVLQCRLLQCLDSLRYILPIVDLEDLEYLDATAP